MLCETKVAFFPIRADSIAQKHWMFYFFLIFAFTI